VSKDAAETLYGAVFEPDALAIDAAATEARRAHMREQGLPHDEPISEVTLPFSTPTDSQMQNPEHERLTEEERTAFAMTCRCCS
jgi:hypothetical protein